MFCLKRNQIIQHFLLTLGQGHLSLRSDACVLFTRRSRLCATNLGENKANVKRNAESNAQSRTTQPSTVSIWHGTQIFRAISLGVVFPLLFCKQQRPVSLPVCVLRHTPRCDILFVSPLSRCGSPARSTRGLCVLGPKELSDHVHFNYTAALKDQARSYRQRRYTLRRRFGRRHADYRQPIHKHRSPVRQRYPHLPRLPC